MKNKVIIFIFLGLLFGCSQKQVSVIEKPISNEPVILSLFSDVKASSVGDLITVQVVENASGSNSIKSKAEKETDTSMDLNLDGTQNGVTNAVGSRLGARTTNDHESESDHEKRASLVANITAVVVHVFSNGNLHIQGEQEIVLDKGVHRIHVSGIARPGDISGTNTILSTRLANAKISYKSKRVPNIHRRGLVGRLFDLVF